jgi:hypothetical protein
MSAEGLVRFSSSYAKNGGGDDFYPEESSTLINSIGMRDRKNAHEPHSVECVDGKVVRDASIDFVSKRLSVPSRDGGCKSINW